ncbi:myrosinase 1 [Frankliniella occidentalis]|uniref:Myrosinase 1 n=1 Tax=Frankliniella occidentalis TaxID=133901 RepID=A0A6J1S5U0_FRAOC|nr:myrosinase 1 [Frankliniella occidentalis]
MRATVPASIGAVGLLLALAASAAALQDQDDEEGRDAGEPLRLPDDFMVGAATSAYQIEGGWNEGGKGLSNLDVVNNDRPDHGGTVACDSYHKYADDVRLLKQLGATHYRFSLAWTRLLPTGEADNVNQDGVRYYNALLDELDASGIKPMVTLYHQDIPQTLQEAFGGWDDEKIVGYFEIYAKTAFALFGKRVKLWTTLNEPLTFCLLGAEHGRLGTSKPKPGISGYRAAHNMLLAHARAYRAYHRDFAADGGAVGLTLSGLFTRPCSTAYEDVRAAERHMQFELGWYLEPLLAGGVYPPMMRQHVQPERLPTFSAAERDLLNGAIDFIGLNSYFGGSACDGVPENAGSPSYERDQAVVVPGSRGNPDLDPDNPMMSAVFQWTPSSIRNSLRWIRDRYDPDNKIPLIVTENGYNGEDDTRMAYLSQWLRSVLRGRYLDKLNIRGYFVWSLMDNFEWGIGYEGKYGLAQVDFSSPNRTRTPKNSFYFMRDVIATRTVPLVERPGGSSGATRTGLPTAAWGLVALLALSLV